MRFEPDWVKSWIRDTRTGVLVRIDCRGKIAHFALGVQNTTGLGSAYFDRFHAAAEQARAEFKAADRLHCHRYGSEKSELRQAFCARLVELLNEQEDSKRSAA